MTPASIVERDAVVVHVRGGVKSFAAPNSAAFDHPLRVRWIHELRQTPARLRLAPVGSSIGTRAR
jgi:hypothetical protein